MTANAPLQGPSAASCGRSPASGGCASGCPRRCWFCKVWKQHPEATPLPEIADGWNVLDDNLLACPRPHVEAVFDMLRRQKRRVAGQCRRRAMVMPRETAQGELF